MVITSVAELERLLDEYDEAKREFDKPLPRDEMEFYKREDRLLAAVGDVQKAATFDTIRALVNAAKAADIFCACERGGEPIGRMSMEIALAPLVKEADE